MDNYKIDIKENYIYQLDAKLLAILLLDKSSGKNIIWATDNYADRGIGYQSNDEIMIDSITHRNGSVIKPRTTKSKKNKQSVSATKRRFLLRPGCATIKIILLTTRGSEKKMFLTRKTVQHGSPQKKELYFRQVRHGRIM